ncbi:MAG: hypothetical protein IKC01_00655 [Clostridia bacterium]|nr:hypothetical protein [Clostridia bacterium]
MSKKFGLTNNQLKLIAMLSMLSDHAGKELFPEYQILQIIGRLAFPIFAYMIAEGCFYTRNKKRYFLTIALLGVGCQAVYFIAERSLYQNILITFSLSVITIFAVESYINNTTKKSKSILFSVISAVFVIAIILPVVLKEQGFVIDYGIYGVLLPVTIFYAADKKQKLFWTTVILIMLSIKTGGIQWCSLASVPLLALYNQKRGKYNIKPLFYVFYPAHLAIIYIISVYLAG